MKNNLMIKVMGIVVGISLILAQFFVVNVNNEKETLSSSDNLNTESENTEYNYETTEEDSTTTETQEKEEASIRDIYNLENLIIVNLLEKTGANLTGCRAIDLNGDGIEELIVSIIKDDDFRNNYYVIDKVNAPHIYEYSAPSMSADYEIYIDEEHGKLYALLTYTMADIESRTIEIWNNGWSVKGDCTMEGEEKAFLWEDSYVTQAEWLNKWEDIQRYTKWKDEELTANTIKIENLNFIEKYVKYLDEKKATYNIHEEAVDGNLITCIDVENYLWMYNENIDTLYRVNQPLVFENGLQQPTVQIRISEDQLIEVEFVEENAVDNVYDIVSEAISRYTIYQNDGICCDLAYDEYLSTEQLSMFLEEEEIMLFDYYKISCCKTLEEAKNHLCQYLDESFWLEEGDEEFYDTLLEYENELYVMVGAKGSVSYDTEDFKVLKNDNGTIVVLSDLYNSGDMKVGECTFVLERRNQRWVITSVEEVSES